MYRTPPAEPSQTFVHHPGPRVVVYGSMVFLAAITAPAFVVDPSSILRPGTLFGLAIFAAFQIVLLSIARRRVLLSVDARLTTLDIRGIRWPFVERSRQVPIANILAVAVQRSIRRPTFRVVLVLTSGEELPLTDSYFGDTGHMGRDAAAIRKLCGLAAMDD